MLCIILVFKIWHGIGVLYIFWHNTDSIFAHLLLYTLCWSDTGWMCMLILNFQCILKRRALARLRKRSPYQSTINLTSVTDKNSLNCWHLYHLIVPSPICVWDTCNLFIHLQLHFQPLPAHISPPLSSSFCFLLPVSKLSSPLSSHDVWLSKIYLFIYFLNITGAPNPHNFLCKKQEKNVKGAFGVNNWKVNEHMSKTGQKCSFQTAAACWSSRRGWFKCREQI